MNILDSIIIDNIIFALIIDFGQYIYFFIGLNDIYFVYGLYPPD